MKYVRSTALEYFSQIQKQDDFWLAMGNFLDDFRSASLDEKKRMTRDPIFLSHDFDGQERFAAFFAALVEHLCYHSGLEIPAWTQGQEFVLNQPWFLHENWRFRAWQLATTPASFKKRNIFGGNNMLDRV